MKIIMNVTFILGTVFIAPDIRYFKKENYKEVSQAKIFRMLPVPLELCKFNSMLFYYYTQRIFHKQIKTFKCFIQSIAISFSLLIRYLCFNFSLFQFLKAVYVLRRMDTGSMCYLLLLQLGVRTGKNIYLRINRVLWTQGFLFIF